MPVSQCGHSAAKPGKSKGLICRDDSGRVATSTTQPKSTRTPSWHAEREERQVSSPPTRGAWRTSGLHKAGHLRKKDVQRRLRTKSLRSARDFALHYFVLANACQRAPKLISKVSASPTGKLRGCCHLDLRDAREPSRSARSTERFDPLRGASRGALPFELCTSAQQETA